MDRDLLVEIFGALGFAFVVFIIIGAMIAAPAMWMSSISCRNKANLMGVEYQWGITTDCMIKIDGRWEPIDWQRSNRQVTR